MPEPIYDVFLSFSGSDRDPCRKLAAELRSQGARVFLDEDDIEPFTGITASIQKALGHSRTLVAYYSIGYAERAACQQELMTAFLAGQREGDPCRRIMVINPEPGSDHLQPVQLADAKYLRSSTGTTLMAREIIKRAARTEGVIGPEPAPDSRSDRLGWSATRAGHPGIFRGRYRELWQLHTWLHAAEYTMIHPHAHGPFVAVCGPPGSGKSALATAYAWRFHSAFPGGTHRISLAGTPSSTRDLRERYLRELREIGPEIDADLDPVPDRHLVGAVRRQLRERGKPSLWIIDDVSDGVDAEAVDFLMLPADSGARTVLISRRDVFADSLPTVRVGPRNGKPESPSE